MRRRWLVGLLGGTLLGGCAGIPPAQVGQAAGTIAGAAVAPGIGPPVGALLGLLAGMLLQGEVDKVTEKRERRTLGDQLAKGPAPASQEAGSAQGEPVRVWVDETVRDGRLTAGHFEVRYLP